MMDGRGKSDGSVVPGKLPNKAGQPAAEAVEAAGSAEDGRRRDLEVGRQDIDVNLAAGNRDPECFEDPERFDVEVDHPRGVGAVDENRHATFAGRVRDLRQREHQQPALVAGGCDPGSQPHTQPDGNRYPHPDAHHSPDTAVGGDGRDCRQRRAQSQPACDGDPGSWITVSGISLGP